MDVDRGDAQPGQALDLVADLRADRRGDLGEVEAVLDHDVEVDRDAVAVRAARDLDPLPLAVAREQPRDAARAAMPTTP